MKILVHYLQDFGRMGMLEGLFITTREELEASYGRTAYFGEVLGKHSDVWSELEDGLFTVLSEDQEFIEQARVIIGGGNQSLTGLNPLEHIGEDEE